MFVISAKAGIQRIGSPRIRGFARNDNVADFSIMTPVHTIKTTAVANYPQNIFSFPLL